MRKYFFVYKYEVVIFVKRERKFLLVFMVGCAFLYCKIGGSGLEMVIFKLKNYKNNMINLFDFCVFSLCEYNRLEEFIYL